MRFAKLRTSQRRRILPGIAMLGLLAAGGGGTSNSTAADANPAPKEGAAAGAATVGEVLELAYQGMGGKPSLRGLAGFAAASTRDRYVLGMGTEPGSGLFKSVSSKAQTSYDLRGERLRQDFRHANLYGLTVEVTELIVQGAGYIIGRDDIYGEARLAAAPLNPGRMAMALKTERLLNPHILLRQALKEPTIASVGKAEFPDTMVVLGEKAVYPIALTFDGATNFRRLLTTEQWLQKWRGTEFVQLATNGDVLVDGQWFNRWQAPRQLQPGDHHVLTIEDALHPLHLHVDKQTGRIRKLATMEHDWAFGDVLLEATYHDWREVDGVQFPLQVKVSVAATPALEVNRSSVNVNPDFDEAVFARPQGVVYEHDELAAKRGAAVSQWTLGLAHAGSPRPMGRPERLEAAEFKPGLHFLRANPEDDDSIRTLVVEQESGLIAVDPGLEDLKSEAMIAWMNQRFPGKPVSHVILTHHHVDHVGGVRPFVAAGAAVVAHEAARDYYLANFSRTGRTVMPDALDRNPVPAKVLGVKAGQSLRLEDPQRPVSVYPVFNRHSSDGLAVLVENEGVLYNGDLYSPGNKVDEVPAEVPLTGLDLERAIQANNLSVRFIAGSHARPNVPYNAAPYEDFKRHLQFHEQAPRDAP